MTQAAVLLRPHPAERRITLRLLAYWEKKRGTQPMPAEEDIDPADIEELWNSCFLVRVADLSRPDYNYSHLGQQIIDAYHSGLTHQPEKLVSPDAKALFPGYRQVIMTGRPLLEEGEFRNLNNDIVKYRQCLLPLGQEGRVTAVFGGMRFKIFHSLEPAN